MIIIFLGPPGVGKGTQSGKLVERLSLTHISTGEIVRDEIEKQTDFGKRAKDLIEQGKLVPDEVIIGIVDKRLDEPDCQTGCLLDGFPRTVPQADALARILKTKGLGITAVIELKADVEVLKRRLVERATEEGRKDDTPEIITKRYKIYLEQTAPIVNYYRKQGLLKEIHSTGTPDEVHENVLRAIREKQ